MTKDHTDKDKKSKSSKDQKKPPAANNIFLSLMRAAAVQIKQPTTATGTSSPSTTTVSASTAPSAGSATSTAASSSAASVPASVAPTTNTEAPAVLPPLTTSQPPPKMTQSTTTTAVTPSSSATTQPPAAVAPVPTVQPTPQNTIPPPPPTPPTFVPLRHHVVSGGDHTQPPSVPETITSIRHMTPGTFEPVAAVPTSQALNDVDGFPIVKSSSLPNVRAMLGYRPRPACVDVRTWAPVEGGVDDYKTPTLFAMELPFLINATPQLPSSPSASSQNSGGGGSDGMALAAAHRLGANLKSILPPTHPLFNTITSWLVGDADGTSTTQSAPVMDAKAKKNAAYINAPHHYHSAGLKRERPIKDSTVEWMQQHSNHASNKRGNNHSNNSNAPSSSTGGGGGGGGGTTSTTTTSTTTTTVSGTTTTTTTNNNTAVGESEFLSPVQESLYMTKPSEYTFMGGDHFNSTPFRDVPVSFLSKCGMASENVAVMGGNALPGNDDSFCRMQNSFVGTPEIATETTLRNDLLIAITERQQTNNHHDDHRSVFVETDGDGVCKGDLRGRWMRKVEGGGSIINTTTNNTSSSSSSATNNSSTPNRNNGVGMMVVDDGDDEEVFVPVSSRYATFLVPKQHQHQHTNGRDEVSTVVDDRTLRRFAMSKLQQQQQRPQDDDVQHGTQEQKQPTMLVLPQQVSFEGFTAASNSNNIKTMSTRNNHDCEDDDDEDDDDEPHVKIIGIVKKAVSLNTPASFTFSQTAMELPQGRTLSYPPSTLLPSSAQHIVGYSFTPPYHIGNSEQVHKQNAHFNAPAPPLFVGEGGLLERVLEGNSTIPSAPTTTTTNTTTGTTDNAPPRPVLVSSINADEEVPTGPTALQVEAVKRRGIPVDANRLRDIVTRLTPDSGMCLIQKMAQLPDLKPFTKHNILRALNTITYCFANGAFRTTRFIYGVDPRIDAEKYAIYQHVSFRFLKYRNTSTIMEGLDDLPFRTVSALKAARDMAIEFITRARAYLAETAAPSTSAATPGTSRGEKVATKAALGVRALREQSIQLLEDFLEIDPSKYLATTRGRLTSSSNFIEGRASCFPAAAVDVFLGKRRQYSVRLIDAVAGNWHLTQTLGESVPHKKCTSTYYGYYSESLYKSILAGFDSEFTSYLQNRVVAASEEFTRGGGEVAVAAFLKKKYHRSSLSHNASPHSSPSVNNNAAAASSSATPSPSTRLMMMRNNAADNNDDDDDASSDISSSASLASRMTHSLPGTDVSNDDDDDDSVIGYLEDVRPEGYDEGGGGDDDEGAALNGNEDAEEDDDEDGSEGFGDFE